MPFVVSGEDVKDSLGQLERILERYPAYRSECSLELASFIKFYAKSNVKKISVFEFTKIRIHLAAIARKEGFPAIIHHTVAFFDLLMFSIPFYTKVSIRNTMENWNISAKYRWRKVRIFDIPDEFGFELLGLIPLSTDDMLVMSTMKRATERDWLLFNNLVSYGGIHNKIIICNWDYVLKKLNEGGY